MAFDTVNPFTFTDDGPVIQVGGATLSLEFVGCDGSRMVYRWTVRLEDGSEYSDADLRSGCDTLSSDAANDQAMWGTFLVFLSACGEGWRYRERFGSSDNADLFPAPVAEWAAGCTDELSMLGCEIEETPGLLADDDDDDCE